MTLKKLAFLFLLSSISSTCGLAQKNEASFSIGALHSSDQKTSFNIVCVVCTPDVNVFNTSIGTGVAIEGIYARQLFNFKTGSLDIELPLVGAPGRNVKISQLGVTFQATATATSLFFTPSVRIKLFRSRPISPFASVGGGLAHFGNSGTLPAVTFFAPVGGFGVPGTTLSASNANHGALQFGGGLDFKTPSPNLVLRAEVRDFWSLGIIEPSSLIAPERQHNIFAGGGVVFRF